MVRFKKKSSAPNILYVFSLVEVPTKQDDRKKKEVAGPPYATIKQFPIGVLRHCSSIFESTHRRTEKFRTYAEKASKVLATIKTKEETNLLALLYGPTIAFLTGGTRNAKYEEAFVFRAVVTLNDVVQNFAARYGALISRLERELFHE